MRQSRRRGSESAGMYACFVLVHYHSSLSLTDECLNQNRYTFHKIMVFRQQGQKVSLSHLISLDKEAEMPYLLHPRTGIPFVKSASMDERGASGSSASKA